MSFFERYAPQIPKSELISDININYQAASNYYQQRQKMFGQVLKNQANITLDSFKNDIDELITKQWNDNIYKVLETIYFDSTKTLNEKILNIQTVFKTDPFLDFYIEAIKKSKHHLFKGQMGKIFEHFINNEIFSKYFEECSNFGNKHLQSLVSGSFTSLSTAVKGVKQIRSDILVSLNDVTFEKDQSIYYGSNKNEKLPLELQRTLTINWDNSFPSFDNEMETSDASILNKFLNNDSFFGFSAKIYNADDDNKHFSNSSTIQSAINEVFWYPSRYSQKRHSWENDYAEVYVIWNLSKILRTIISPTTIAMIYGDSMMWMSNFLQSKLFYMRLSYVSKIGNHEAGEDRIFPSITSSGISTKNYNLQKGLSAINTKLIDIKNRFGRIYKGIEITLS